MPMKTSGGSSDQPGAECPADGQQLEQVRQDFGIATHGQQALRPPGLEAPLQHVRAPDADSLEIGPARLQPVQQQAGQQIT
jgi:hypothetical protein